MTAPNSPKTDEFFSSSMSEGFIKTPTRRMGEVFINLDKEK
jgi:hypothetical protein